MELGTIMTLIIVALIVLFQLAFVWYINIGSVLTAIKSWRVAKRSKEVPLNLTCSVDTDCPTGYICVGGRCIPQRA
jgi:hypothetical protein